MLRSISADRLVRDPVLIADIQERQPGVSVRRLHECLFSSRPIIFELRHGRFPFLSCMGAKEVVLCSSIEVQRMATLCPSLTMLYFRPIDSPFLWDKISIMLLKPVLVTS